MNKFIALVPMKAYSVRVKNKNIRKIAGLSLFHYILKTLLKCGNVSGIYVDTDSDNIKTGISRYFKEVNIIDRPAHLIGDSISMNEIIEYDISQIKGDLFLQTHSTNPLLKAETIDRAIDFYLAHPQYDSLFSVTKMLKRYYDAKGNPVNHDISKLINTQQLTPLFEENSNIYLFTRKSFEYRKNRIGKTPSMFEISKEEAIDIDDEFEFEQVETLINRRLNTNA